MQSWVTPIIMRAMEASPTRRNHMLGFVILISVALLLVGMFKSQFILGAPSKEFSGCLTYSGFLVSRWDKEISLGGLYAVTLDHDMRNAKAGERLVKMLIARGGDRVRVEEDGVWVNDDHFYRVPLRGIAQRLKLNITTLKKTIIVPPGQIYLVGNTDRSYDSRFWGTLNEKSIVGRAYAIW